MSKRKHQRLLLAVQAGLLAASIGLYQPAAQAMPTGGISTTATFADKGVVDGRTQLDVIGSEARNVIAWDSFNLASNEAVHFTGKKDYLNYVAGTDRSFIDGRVFGDGGGTVYIINPHGIIFGDNAVIDNIGSLYASTRNLTEADFTAFKEGGSLANTATLGGDIVNRANLSDMNITLEGDTVSFSRYDSTANKVGGTAAYTVKADRVNVGYSDDTAPTGTTISNVNNNNTINNLNFCKLVDDLEPLTSNGNYMLNQDIDTTTNNTGTPYISNNFSGTLDGAGHQITLHGAPLFNRIENSGIYNLNLAGSVSATNAIYTGALAQQISSSTITSVTNTATVSSQYNASDASDGIYIGGIAGFIDEPTKIKNVSNQGDVSSTNGTAYTTYIGGIAGLLTGSTITSPSGTSEAPRVTSVYNTGDIQETNASATSYAGGIAGVIENSQKEPTSGYIYYYDVDIDKSYNTGDVSAKNSGGLVGLSRSNPSNTRDKNNPISKSYSTGTISGTTIGLASSANHIAFTNSYDKEANQYYKEAGAAPVTADKITDGGAWRVYNSQPVLTAFLQKLELKDATYTYDGLSHSLFTIYGTTTHLPENTISVSGTDAGTYTQGALYSDQHGYDLTSTTPVLTINPVELTLTANQATKEYDGTTEVKGEQPYYTATGLVNGEQISGLTVAYDTPDVGIGNKTVKITNTGAIKTADENIVPITKNYKIIAINDNNTSSITKPPSEQPTNQPPSDQPTNQPPSDQPTNQSSDQPANQPSDQPTDQPVDPQSGTNQAVDNYNSITGDIHVEAGSDGNDPDGDSQLKDSAGNTSIDTTHNKQAIKVDEDALARALHEDGNEGVDISSEKSGKVETETINVGDFSDGDESGKAAK